MIFRGQFRIHRCGNGNINHEEYCQDEAWYCSGTLEAMLGSLRNTSGSVEGFCSEAEWRRAYREINEMEAHLAHAGAVLRKFWLHVSPGEQLRRFLGERDRDDRPEAPGFAPPPPEDEDPGISV